MILISFCKFSYYYLFYSVIGDNDNKLVISEFMNDVGDKFLCGRFQIFQYATEIKAAAAAMGVTGRGEERGG